MMGMENCRPNICTSCAMIDNPICLTKVDMKKTWFRNLLSMLL